MGRIIKKKSKKENHSHKVMLYKDYSLEILMIKKLFKKLKNEFKPLVRDL
jgi:hypothetical protein